MVLANPTNEEIRKQIERLYCATMTVVVKEAQKNKENRQTEFRDTVRIEGAPCRISYGTGGTVEITDGAPEIRGNVKLFCAPDIDIPEGSKITVTQHGITADYRRSGAAAVYRHHQEVEIEPAERWA